MKTRLLLFFLLLTFFLPFQNTAAQPVVTENAVTELVSEQKTIQPGQTFWIGVHQELREGWYVYYRNPGDSGMPLMLEWVHDKDFQIGDIEWPTPLWIDVSAGMASHGYYGSVLFMMEATAPEDLIPGEEYTLMAEADWLICEVLCIPEYADLELTLLVTDEEPIYNEDNLALFNNTRTQLPVVLDYWKAEATIHSSGATLTLSTDEFPLPDYSEIVYFAKEEGEIENGAAQPFNVDGNTITIELKKSTYKSGDIDRLWGLVYNASGWDEAGTIPSIIVDVSPGEESVAASDVATMPVLSSRFMLILVFAFIGGMILNLMPCVFPILSIKVMNFMQMAGHDPKKVRLHGYMFGAGVLLSFLFLALLLIGLRAGGQELGWGFQLQTPAFIAFMTFLMFALGLSLMGVFEIGNSLINVAGKANTGEGMRGSFFSGILATVLATPCTAPFMGTAIGVAITLPATTSLIIFAALGLGMAAPYVLLSSFPALMKFMPKPGAWMETFKQAMAFPLFATAIWLIWVYGQQAGIDGLTRLLVGLLLLSLGIWILHRWKAVQISGTARIVSRSIATAIIIGGFLFSVPQAGSESPGNEISSSNGFGIDWIAYSESGLQQKIDEGNNIFIDFTAAWCITCKANERIVFSSDRVKDKFNDLNFVMVKADWTNRNPEITRALESFGRNGVPLYVIYSPSLEEPMILPELLTPGIVMDALEKVSGGTTLTFSDS
ncbi:MAG: DUF255 domain-containing protein [Balneolaceae bacterium]|nr:MAG: DUF255 domain-containing protein [Balneolaceae bacterium]